MSKKTPDPNLRVWSYPTCSVNGFGLLEQGHTYDLARVPEGVRDHPAWDEPAEKEQDA